MKQLSVIQPGEIAALPFQVEIVSRDLRLNDLEIWNDDDGDYRYVAESDVRRLTGAVLIRFDSKEARRAYGGRSPIIGVSAHCPRLERS